MFESILMVLWVATMACGIGILIVGIPIYLHDKRKHQKNVEHGRRTGEW